MKTIFLITALGLSHISFLEFDAICYELDKEILIKRNISNQKINNESWDKMVKGVKHFEGYYSKPYYCSGKVKTIGYGHTGTGVKRGYVTKPVADELLEKDLEQARQEVKKHVKVPLTEGQMACLVSFVFNCGEENLKRLVNGKNRLNGGNYKSVERILPMYRKADGKILKGLVKRRSWELELWKEKEMMMVKN